MKSNDHDGPFWGPLLLATLIAVVLMFAVSCTVTGDLKYKTSDRPETHPTGVIDGRDPSGYPQFLYHAGLALGCELIMHCYGQE